MFEQLANLYRGLSMARRVSVLGAALALGGGLTWLAANPSRVDFVPVQGGRTFTGQELAAARERLAAAQLRDYKIAGRQILVPSGEAARFEAALAEESAATGWAGAWREANDSLSPFASGRQQHDAREIARARLISEMLKQLPDVEHAEIVWDEEQRVGWRQPPRVRATVYLQPRERREITLDMVDAVKRAVAGSKAHLDPADVVVMDLRRMVAYGQGTAGEESAPSEQRLAALTAAYRRRIEDALADIPGVHVAVIVEPAPGPNPTAVVVGDVTPGELRVPERKPQPASASPPAPRGGPNQRLAIDPSPPAVEPEGQAAATDLAAAPSESDLSATATAEIVRAIVSLPPDYVRNRAVEHDTAALFARRTPAEQQSLLAEMEHAIVQDIQERTVRIIPGATLVQRRALVKVATHEAPLPAAEPADRASADPLPAALATLARWDRPAQWAVGALLGYLVLWQLVRAIGRRRLSQSMTGQSARPVGDQIIEADTPHRRERPRVDERSESTTEQAERLLERLNAADPSEWGLELAGIATEVIGALLQTLEPERVSSVMAALSPEAQQQALAHLAGLGPSGRPPAPLVQPVRRAALPIAARASDPADLDELDDADPVMLRTLYAQLPGEVWSTALMGASAAFRVRLLSALPAADAAALRQSLTRQRPARLRDIETAQHEVLELLHGRGALAAAR